jgi:ABC-type taurine transport system ATPase subunit
MERMMTELAISSAVEPLEAAERGRPPLLAVSHLTLRFGGVAALTDVCFEVASVEPFGVIGPNGAGKTCILNCLNGVYRSRPGGHAPAGHRRGGRGADVPEPGVVHQPELSRSAMWHNGKYDRSSSTDVAEKARRNELVAAIRLACDSMAPLGGPVVPDV